MAKISRVKHKIFGSTGATANFGKFGSATAGTPLTSKDITTLTSLGAWNTGWQDALVVTANGNAPCMEEENAVIFVHSTQLAYVFQEGIPEWETGTTYWIGSIVKKTGTTELYGALTDNESGNALPNQVSSAKWEYLNPESVQDMGLTAGAIPVVSLAAVAGSSPAQLSDSHISQDANNIILAKQIKFPDNTVQASSAATFSIQSAVTGSRSLTTVFRNTSGKVMLVTVTLQLGAGSGSGIAYVDINANPTTPVAEALTGIVNTSGPVYMPMTFMVLPNHYYKVIPASACGLIRWTEWT